MSGLSDVDGLRIGHFTDARRPTGCTVVLAEAGATCGVDVRGGAPGTRETALLDPVKMVSVAHAILLTGGSAFGLDAATGVMRFLEERGAGLATSAGPVPIVAGAVLFDLAVGDPGLRPDAAAGYAACVAAASGPLEEGSVGAGAGATVGKLFGAASAMKGGLGTASLRAAGGGPVVAALMVVNAVGDVVDESGRIVAGARHPEGRGFLDTVGAVRRGHAPGVPLLENTTIGVVATDAALTKPQATRLAQAAHDGLARRVRPAHTPWDGDTIFALATGSCGVPLDASVGGILAAEAVSEAILRAVEHAKGLPGVPSVTDLARR